MVNAIQTEIGGKKDRQWYVLKREECWWLMQPLVSSERLLSRDRTHMATS